MDGIPVMLVKISEQSPDTDRLILACQMDPVAVVVVVRLHVVRGHVVKVLGATLRGQGVVL